MRKEKGERKREGERKGRKEEKPQTKSYKRWLYPPNYQLILVT